MRNQKQKKRCLTRHNKKTRLKRRKFGRKLSVDYSLRVQLLQCEKQCAVQKGRIKITDRPEKTLKDLKTNHKTDRSGGNPQGYENRS